MTKSTFEPKSEGVQMTKISTKDWLHNSRGEWYLIGQALFTLAVLFAPRLDGHAPSWFDITIIAGGALCIVGLSFVVLGSIGLGQGRSLSAFPKPNNNATLVTNGIFSVVRHPIYSGFIIWAFGWSLIWSSVAAVVATLALLFFFDFKARREERWLEAKFSDYTAYKQRIKKLIPFLY
jgi:protein-S-isoprenylcysteine O-methyltransferase Ste14